LLILDEPLSGLDPVGRRDVAELLSAYKKNGGTLFFTSHVLHDVERLADRFGLIHDGQIQSVRSPNELVGDEEVFLVRSAGLGPVADMSEDSPGRWAGEISRTRLWQHLNDLQAAGHVLQEVRSTLSLEAAFLRAVGRD
jgi:ABC-2 type transport system ATP-binding protein